MASSDRQLSQAGFENPQSKVKITSREHRSVMLSTRFSERSDANSIGMLWRERSRRYRRICVIPLSLAKYLIVMATPAEVLGRSILNGLDQQTIPFGRIGPKSLFSAFTNPSWETLFNLPVAQGAADNQRRREPSARPGATVVVSRASSVPIRTTTQPPWSSTPVRHH